MRTPTISRLARRLGPCLLLMLPAAAARAQTVSGLVWRNVGPFRAGRVSAVSGAIGEPGVFYAGFPAAGLWKTTNAGATWEPIFDAITSVSSIGAVEVAPSDTSFIYVGTGDKPAGGNIDEGDGVYKSTDAGRTWRHIGLDSTRQIPSILVDPRDPNLVLVAAQGDLHARGGQRGLYRTTDGGQSWTRTLYIDDVTGIEKLGMAFDEPDVVFATTDRHWVPSVPVPPAPGAPPTPPPATGLYKSTDEGMTWHEVTGGGLPRLSGRVLVAVAMHTHAQRVFVIGNFGLYRSDDGGTTWRQMDADDRRVGNGQGGYNSGVLVSPRNPDVIYTINTSSYVSTDGGNTFTGFKGAPGGDDPQVLWIDPTDGQRMLMGIDQGAVVTLDGGRTWSSWFNQSTEQVYHVSVDSSFPYWIYATQQDAGAVRTRSRGNYGAITPMDWSPAGTWEWGTIVADPRDPNIVYGSGAGIQRVVWPSEQFIDVGPGVDPALTLRTTTSQPLLWAPWNPRELLFGTQFVMATTDGGLHWRTLSPDLGYPAGYPPPPPPPPNVPPPPPAPGAPRAGAIESMSASHVARGLIWVGTSTGLIKLTRDEGLHWTDVSIPNLPDSNRSSIAAIEASHHDPPVAYVAVDGHTTGDYAPQLYRTRDFGATWTRIVTGLPTGQVSGSFTRLIREDTRRAGLLFAGTESGMFVSFDDGDRWQSLQLNMPTASSFRDALIVGNDLVVGTYGRGIWILDDISPLRQLTPDILAERAHVFATGGAVRVHRNVNQNTPFPPEMPHALNPPEGVAIYYSLASAPTGEVTLDVLDAGSAPVRHLTSAPTPPVADAARPPEPNFWLATPQPLPTAIGINRTNWDLRYDPPPAFTHSFEINANPGLTPASPEGPLVRPGTYTLRLTVDGTAYTTTVTVTNDPRARATAAELTAQADLQRKVYRMIGQAWDGFHQADAMRTALAADTGASVAAEVGAAARALLARIDTVAGRAPAPGAFGFGRRGPTGPNFVAVHGALVRQLNAQDLADHVPTAAALAAFESSCKDMRTAVAGWNGIRDAFNALQASHGKITPASTSSPTIADPSCSSPPRSSKGTRTASSSRSGSAAVRRRP